jgi:formylglycine-generating enzyme required for sulfatase activity
MAVLLVSHSSKDDPAATALEAWLRAKGFMDIFIDHTMAGGERWQEELRASAGACRVIICLVTENWLASPDCFGEFIAAGYMGKRIIPLFLFAAESELSEDAEKKLKRVRSADQGIDLAPCLRRNGLLDLEANPAITARLANGLRAAGALTRIGLDPEAFATDRDLRPMPFPGLASFGDDDADAALFYGRSREIAEILEELRKVRAERDLRPFVILGASGAGKSSLLKAGIIPRLRREVPAWLPLRAFRPGADPLLNFAEALARTLGDFGKVEAHGIIRDRMFAVWKTVERKDNELTPAGWATLEAALEAEGRKLRVTANRDGATILISVDQAEELARAEGDGAEALADFLQVALASAISPWQLAFTIRTDSFPELQRHYRFQDLKARGYDLRAVPVFRFENVVEEPAKRYGVKIDEELIAALINDSPEEDALPLLAFALQRLWRRYAAAGAISKENYHSVGGLKQLIEDAAERALRGFAPEQDAPLPPGPPPRQRTELAAATFVPALAQLNDQGAVIRRAAPWSEFGGEQQQLLIGFDQWRLIVRKATDADGSTVEVAHEALFREWTRLKNWLQPERARLEALRSLQLDALTWDRNGRAAAFLNHRDKRLVDATALSNSEAYRERLVALDLNYLAACRDAERSERQRRRRSRAAIYVLLIGVIIGLVGWIKQDTIADEWRWWTVTRPYAVAQVWHYVLSAANEKALKPGDSFRECAQDCPEMVVVPTGSFMMGSSSGQGTDLDRTVDGAKYQDLDRTTKRAMERQAEGYTNEAPQHLVTIAKPFAVAKFELTFADWDACVTGGGCNGYKPFDQGWGRDHQPVINVNWDDAQAYVAWLSAVTGNTYRLLSESEFEYATRAGTTTLYPWGDEIPKDDAPCDGCLGSGESYANCHGCGAGGGSLQPIGMFRPNKFGLYDMVGNVWEWTEDCFHFDYIGAPADGSALLQANGGDCSKRIIRGGSWSDAPDDVRSAARFWQRPVARDSTTGFRVGRTLLAP